MNKKTKKNGNSLPFKLYKHPGVQFFVGLLLLFVLVGFVEKRQREKLPQKLHVEINPLGKLKFVNHDDVQFMLENSISGQLKNNKVRDLNFKALEKTLIESDYIADAEIYADYSGNVFADIYQRKPIMRMVNRKQKSFYVDELGHKFPLSYRFAAKVPVFNGYFDEAESYEALESEEAWQALEMAKQIRASALLKSVVGQVYLDKNGAVFIFSRIGKHKVELGHLNQSLNGQLDKLSVFYKEINRTGKWSDFKNVNLKYDNQIIIKK